MKLYSRGQLLFVGVASALLVVLLVVGFGVFGGIGAGESDVGTAVSGVQEIHDLELQTNHGSGTLIPAATRTDYSEDELENIRVFDMRNQGVVNITTETLTYNWFLEPVPEEGTTGSGSIIDARGYVLTNYHVVQDAVRVYVTLSEGESVEGDVIGADPENDLAVVKFEPDGRELTTVPLGISSDLRVGQKVLAIGNPFALGRTLTTGVISGVGRSLRAYNDLVISGMIQTDASINPGNSGGPLLDSRGDMIGINTMIYSTSGGSIGIGFAVPVDTAKRVVPDLIEHGHVVRGWIELVPVEIVPQLAALLRVPAYEGLLVSAVEPGGNAAEAGLRGGRQDQPVRFGRAVIYLGGDIVLEVGGVPVNSRADLYKALEPTRPGEEVTVVYRRGGRRAQTTVTLTERPSRREWE
jgi:S1-C subfamily serine protease